MHVATRPHSALPKHHEIHEQRIQEAQQDACRHLQGGVSHEFLQLDGRKFVLDLELFHNVHQLVDEDGLLAGLLAVVGHNWPCFFQFKGGKGVSSTLSAMLITFPIHAICCYVVGAIVIAVTKYVSLGSIVVISLFTIAVILKNMSNWKVIVWVLIMAALLIWRHKENIKRLLNGTERKLGEKKK